MKVPCIVSDVESRIVQSGRNVLFHFLLASVQVCLFKTEIIIMLSSALGHGTGSAPLFGYS